MHEQLHDSQARLDALNDERATRAALARNGDTLALAPPQRSTASSAGSGATSSGSAVGSSSSSPSRQQAFSPRTPTITPTAAAAASATLTLDNVALSAAAALAESDSLRHENALLRAQLAESEQRLVRVLLLLVQFGGVRGKSAFTLPPCSPPAFAMLRQTEKEKQLRDCLELLEQYDSQLRKLAHT
jgi:hypothetical protein